MQPDIAAHIQQIVTRFSDTGSPVSLGFHPVGGGSINQTYRVVAKDPGAEAKGNKVHSTDDWVQINDNRVQVTGNRQFQGQSQWFCKINDAGRFPGLFRKEQDGLALLEAQHIIRVPAVLGCETVGPWQILIMEWIEQGVRNTSFWRLFGEQLARLHQVTRPSAIAQSPGMPHSSFGLGETSSGSSNYMGALTQSNAPSPDWVSFFIQQRLAPQIRLAAGNGLLDSAAIRQFERLYQRLPDLFPDSTPSLLHGDLWNGNFLCDETGRPELIDPAVYFDDRNMDLAMTTLFGGFDREFYESYAYYSPLPSNYQELWDICNLYPLLIHLNLFGKSYLGTIVDTIQRF